MFDTIEKLRQKPVHTRRLVAFATTSVFMALILVVWFTGFRAQLDANDKKETYLRHSPLSSLRESFSEMTSSAGTGWKNLKSGIAGSVAKSDESNGVASTSEGVYRDQYDSLITSENPFKNGIASTTENEELDKNANVVENTSDTEKNKENGVNKGSKPEVVSNEQQTTQTATAEYSPNETF